MKRLFVMLVAVSSVLALAAGAASANILNVPAEYPTIKEAINTASWSDTVLVAPGEYVESIRLKPGVTVKSASGPEITTIRSDGSYTYTWGSWYVYTVIGADNSVISGFTITGATFAIVNDHCSPTITHNIIADNMAGLTDLVSASVITDNIITRNDMGLHGWRASSTISNNTITGNRWAGVVTDWSTSRITNNAIFGNHWGIYNQFYSYPSVTNNTIAGNEVGVYNSQGCGTTITNNIITGNGTGVANKPRDNYWGGSFPTITFNDLWENGSDIYDDWWSHSTVADNISADPMFVNAAAGNYRLQAGSSCIDAGTNSASGLPETDFDGNPRMLDGNGDGVAVADMGAFEFQKRCVQTPEFEIVSFGPEIIWPPDHKTVDVTLSGKIIVPEGCALLNAKYRIADEYGIYTSEGALTFTSGLNFTVSIPVEAWRDGRDGDGRQYGITLNAEDEAGKSESGPYNSVVPHDMGKK